MLNPESLRMLAYQSLGFVRISAIIGFITAATLVINLNHKAFVTFLGHKSKSFWWLFVLLALIPFLFTLYIFSLIFGRIFPSQAGI